MIWENVADIFITQDQTEAERIDTLYHELTHAVLGFHRHGLSNKKEEILCRAIGRMAAREFDNA